MSAVGRTEKSMMNVLTGVFGQLFSFILSFAIRTVFIKTLGEIYLGLNGLFSNILSVLNLTELGLGTAIVIELYRTVAQKDEEKTKQYLEFYRKAYYCIGIIILIIGLILLPFLDVFINDSESLNLINYRLIFLLYLFNTVFSYFFFAYREAILQANQLNYISGILRYIFKFIEMIIQIIALIIFKDIYAYLIIPLVLGCVYTVVRGLLIGKWFPFIREKPEGKLSREELKTTSKNIFSVALYKISGTVINSTDNIILSSFVSIIITGLYSNYLTLISSVNTILTNVTGAFTAGLGNLNVDAGDNYEKKYNIFKTLSFLDFWIYGFCATCFFVLFDPFITIWIGEKFVMNTLTESVIVLNFLISGLQSTVVTHRAAYGLFYKGRFRPIFSVILNIVFSILFVKILPEEYGIVGVLLGTILSNLFVSWWFDGYIVHKYAFNRKPWSYYLNFWFRIIYVSLFCVALRVISTYAVFSPWVTLIVNFLLCTVIYNIIFIIIFGKTKEFIDLKERLILLIFKKIKKK